MGAEQTSKSVEGDAESGCIVIRDLNDFLSLVSRRTKRKLQNWKRSMEENHTTVSSEAFMNHAAVSNGTAEPFRAPRAVLLKVSDKPCSIKVSQKYIGGLRRRSEEGGHYEMKVILSDISYDVSKPTEQKRILVTSGYLVIADPDYYVTDDKQKYLSDNDAGDNYLSSFQFDSDGKFTVTCTPSSDRIEITQVTAP